MEQREECRSKVRAGAVAPEQCVVEVRAPNRGVDMRTATAASIVVRGPGAIMSTWDATIAGGSHPPAPTRDRLFVVHPYAATDVVVPGQYEVVARVSMPAGTVRSPPCRLEVEPQFDRPGAGRNS
jgi:hypothetical protein